MKKLLIPALTLLVSVPTFAGPLDAAWLCGTTDKDALAYKVGEEIILTLTPSNVVGEVPMGEYFLDWKRTDDFGGVETGRVAFTGAPFVYKARLDKPGFVRLEAYVTGKDGKRYKKQFTGDATTPEGQEARNRFERARKDIFFDGGAGAEPEKLVSFPEPKDFDQFWSSQFARLDKVPIKADTIEIASKNDKVRVYAVRVDCAGLRPVTGYLSVPKAVDEGKTFSALLNVHGYSGDSCKHGGPRVSNGDEIMFDVNAHGLKLPEFGATEADTKALRWEIRSHDKAYAFDPEQNKDPEVAYFNGMVLRVKRALQYMKTVKGWDGKNLNVFGGSQGGLQAVWAAGCGEDVTRMQTGVTWCCDMANNDLRRSRKVSSDGWYVPWTPSMGYYDPVNFAKRIPTSCWSIVWRAGLGDYCCPPRGLAMLYNNIKGNKCIHWVQGSQHGYVPPEYAGRDFKREDKTK